MVWGRGWTEEVVETLAAAWGVNTFILGHQHVESGVDRVGQRIVVLNSDHDHGMVIPVDLSMPPVPANLAEKAIAIRSYIPLPERRIDAGDVGH